MTASPDLPLSDLAGQFRRFADVECTGEPLYAAICRAFERDEAKLRLLWAAPREQQRPNLVLAALHDLVLGGTDHPLRDYFPDLGGARPVDRELPAVLDDFCAAHRDELIELIRRRTTQTNEVGRCRALWPALHVIARRTQAWTMALIDVGCSAGLNLGVDRYRYAGAEASAGAGADASAEARAEAGADASAEAGAEAGADASARTSDASVVLRSRFVGARRPSASGPAPQIVDRLGVDPAPIDLSDPLAARWLRACVWPHDRERADRLERAMAVARQARWTVRREPDCTRAVEDFVSSLAPGVLPVIFNSWVLAYFDPGALERHRAAMEALVARGAAWLSAEPPSVRFDDAEVPPPVEPTREHVEATLWTVALPGHAPPRYTVLARSHPHCTWIQWLADET